jgi:hypothetical protein
MTSSVKMTTFTSPGYLGKKPQNRHLCGSANP